MIERRLFGKIDGKNVYAYTLESGDLQVTLIDYGAAIQSLKYRGRELTLGHDSLEGYINKRDFFGATIGRIANRVADGKFVLDGKTYTLDKNDGDNCLHGGFNGFDRRVFDGRIDGERVVFTLTSSDGDQGCGGTIEFKVTYFVEDGALNVIYSAVSDRDTVFAPTNHTFFNFSGKGAPVYDTYLMINADKFTPVDEKLIPTGELKDVEGTPYDFRSLKKIGRDIGADYGQLKAVGGGYDQSFVLNGELAAEAIYDGVHMRIYTDFPAIQLYSGNFLGGEKCRGLSYGKHCAFCLEPQYYPNAVNEKAFKTPRLKAGGEWIRRITYKFC